MIFGIIKDFIESKKFTLKTLCIQHVTLVKPPWKALEIKFNLKFGKKREIWGLYWIVRIAKYRGRYPSTLLIRTILANNPFTKIFQNFKTYFLTTFNTFLMKTAWFWNLYFKLLLIKLFVPILDLSRFELNGYSPVSVLSREASTSL